jgi:predicted amidohydrolase
MFSGNLLHEARKLFFRLYIPVIRSFEKGTVFIMVIITVFMVSELPASDTVLFYADTFSSVEEATAAGWVRYSQRDEIRPGFFITDLPNIGGKGSLGISGASNSSSNGCWRKTITGIKGGAWYRFEAMYHSRMVLLPRYQIIARLDWRNSEDKRAGQPEYVPDGERQGEWQQVTGLFRAPEQAVAVYLELHLRFSDQGTVLWDGIRLAEATAPPERKVRVGTANCYPRDMTTSAESVEEFCKVAENAGKQGCDIVCLGEGINLAGVNGKIYPDVAESIPGPTTERLGDIARKWKMYIVAALGERDGHAVYNTAVLIDRWGRVAGRYRKVHLPREEIEWGVTPGESYPVFDTDFGRIGMMICWDVQYAEPARALTFQGAEMIFVPIWGGNVTLTQARAIENQIHIISSGYTIASTIYDPWGNLLAEAKERPGLAIVDINLNETHPEPWLGNMRHRFYRELRTDIPVPGMK